MTTSMKGRWPYYRNCFECGVAARKACRDQADNLAAEPCAGRRLMSEPAEHIEDDVVAPAPEPEPAPVKVYRPSPVVRTAARSADPVVIAGHIMAFDDAAVKPASPVHCYDDELFPFKPIAKPVTKKCCAYCRASIVDENGHMRTCRKVECTRRREAARGVAA